MSAVAFCASTYMTLAVTVERYIAVCRPHQYRTISQVRISPVPHFLTGSYLTGSALSYRFVSHQYRTISQVRIPPVPHHLTDSYPTCTAPSHRFGSHHYRTISQVRIPPVLHHLTGSYHTSSATSHRFEDQQFYRFDSDYKVWSNAMHCMAAICR